MSEGDAGWVFSARTIEVRPAGQPLNIAAYVNEVTSRPRPDVIWLHANGFNALTYRNTLAPLTNRLSILAIDQRGHGRTAQQASSSQKRDAHDLRDDLLALMEAVTSNHPVILAGHSLGGCVCLLAAAAAATKVRGLVLFDPLILPRDVAEKAQRGGDADAPIIQKARGRRRTFESRAAAFDAYRSRPPFSRWPEVAVRDYVEDGFRETTDGQVELTCAPDWEAANYAANAHDIWGAMARVEAPVQICRADNGSICAVTRASDFPRPPGQVTVNTIGGSSHFLPIEQPQIVREALLSMANAHP